MGKTSKIFKTALVVLCAFLIIGCGNKTETEKEKKSSESNNSTYLKDSLTENLYVIIDGVKYDLNNISYDKFKSNGWKVESKYENTMIEGLNTNEYHQTKDFKLYNNKYNDEAYILVKFYNDNDDEVKLGDAKILYIAYNGAFARQEYEFIENQPNIELPGKLNLGSTSDDVKKIFGSPDLNGNEYYYKYMKNNDGYRIDLCGNIGVCGFEFYKDLNM